MAGDLAQSCPMCGAKNAGDAHRCLSCGERFALKAKSGDDSIRGILIALIGCLIAMVGMAIWLKVTT